MNREMVTLSKKENKRAMVLRGVDRGEVPVAEAGEVMGLSQRHVRRLLAKYRRDGPQGLAHGNRGRKPCHALDAALCARILELAQTKYVRFNQQHFTEKLQEVEAIEVSRSSVRRLLVGSGIKSPRKRRAPKHRSRRERKAQEGMMLQIDGSRHDWLEGRGSWLTLVGGIDDASGIVPHALFREQEDAQGYFLLVEQIATRYGLPMSVYADGHGIFVRNHKDRLTVEEELQGEPEPTQFGRLLRELDIELIQALSPQAKGRIERLWGTFQDRLVSELRLAGARSLEEANRVLWQFLPEHNRKFAVKPAQASSAYRPLPAGMKWEKVLCFKYGRVVANDNTVKLGRLLIQIPPGAGGRSYAKARVMVHEGMDGSLSVYYQGKRIAYQQGPEQTPVLRVQKRGLPDVGSMENAPLSAHEDKNPIPAKHMAISVPRRPAPNHPWRRPVLVT
jgi:transposase